jgi:hypothetical protein
MLHVWLYTKIESTWHAFEPEVPNRYNRRSAGWKTEEFVSRPGQGFSGLETCRPALSPAEPPGYCVTGAPYLWLRLSGREAVTHCHVVRTLRGRGTASPVSLDAVWRGASLSAVFCYVCVV